MTVTTAIPRLTVAIPLYRGSRWDNNIIRNIQRIPQDARIILSDEVSSDRTAETIAGHFAHDPRIRVRMRNGLPGCWNHFNALIVECDTELFSLLPQDDLVGPGYYEKLVQALDDHSDRGIAFGTIIEHRAGGHERRFPPPPFALGTCEPWMEAILLDSGWSPWIPFRGVIRKNVLKPIPINHRNDIGADHFWIFNMALTTHLIEVRDALYYKRVYRSSTSAQWELILKPTHEERLTAGIDASLPPAEAAKARLLLGMIRSPWDRIASSRSWKITAPLRKLNQFGHTAARWLLFRR